MQGVDLGGTKTKIGILDEKGEILIKEMLKTFSEKGMETTLNRIWGIIEKLMDQKEINKENMCEIVVNSKLISGMNGAGGEIGHIKLVEDGKLCGCGQRGCFEVYASATGVIREAKSCLAVNKNKLLYKSLDGNLEKLEAKDVFDCAKAGDEFSIEIVNHVGNYLGVGIGNLLNVINPEIIILSGGVALAGEILLDVVKDKLKKYAMPVTLNKLEIKLGELGNDAGIKGGITLFL